MLIPVILLSGPFTNATARSLGVSEKMLRGKQFRRLLPRVWVHVDFVMCDLDWIIAAALAMPDRAHVSHLTRIQRLGLDFGPLRPFHFVVAGDLHLDVPDIFLHRTEVLPPCGAEGVAPAVAFIQFCATARLIDAIKVGDWLLRNRHMTTLEVAELARRDRWRPGAAQVRRILPHLNAASRSMKESEMRALVVFAGLPTPECNIDLIINGRWLGCVDLLLRQWLLVLEYEGRQHATDPAQFNSDIVRYAGFRDSAVDYIQITQEMLRQPRAMILRIHHKLVGRGYVGPAPMFAGLWRSLFEPVRVSPCGGGYASKIGGNVDANPPPN